MRMNQFRFEFNQVNFFGLRRGIWLYSKLVELWFEESDELIRFKNIDEALDYEIDGVRVREIIEEMEHLPRIPLQGGRGASSGSQRTFKFTHAEGFSPNKRELLPAKMNTRIKNKSFESAVSEFTSRHRDSDHEWLAEIDDQGYVHQYSEGQKHHVNGIGTNTSRNGKTMIVHNHPSGGHFSDGDLLTTAADKRRNGIIATPRGKNYYYKFEKGTHFRANEFSRAIRNAKLKGKSYDDAADRWLSAHAKKYGYKYSKVKQSK